MLTDCVFWFIIFPFLTVKDYNLNFVSKSAVFPNMAPQILTNEVLIHRFLLWQLLIGMHSVNAVFLLGEAALNSLVSST